MPGRLRVDEKPVQQFQRKRPVNLIGVVPISFEMVLDHAFETILLPVRAGESERIKQHFANVAGQEVPVPDAEMVVLVPAKEQALQVKWSQEMIDLRYPLRHAVIVSIFRLKGKIMVLAENGAGKIFASAGEAHVGPNLPQGFRPIANQADSKVIISSHSLWRAEKGPHHVFIEEWRPHGELRLFQGQQAVMVPWGLPEGRKRKRMGVHDSGVSLLRCGEVRTQV
jgi:hypothetical protein